MLRLRFPASFVAHQRVMSQMRLCRGWGAVFENVDASPQFKIAQRIHEVLPPSQPVLLSNVTKLLPDDVLDELDVGLKQLFEAHSGLFRLGVDRFQNPTVTHIALPKLLPRATIQRLQEILSENDGRMQVDTLFKALTPAERIPVAPFRTLTAALMPLRDDFIVKDKDVHLPPHRMLLVAEAKKRQLAPILKKTPRFVAPLCVVAATNQEAPLELYERCLSHRHLFDLVTPGPEPPSLEGLAGDAYFAECFLRVLPPFHDAVDATAVDPLYETHLAEDYDAYRLARHLSTDTGRPISDLGDAAAELTKPLLQVIASFPELFAYDEATRSVRFVLRQDYKPSPMMQYTDKEIEERMAKLKSDMMNCDAKLKFERKGFKAKIDKLKHAKLIRARPNGSVFMDPNVLAQFIYDTLPSTDAVDVARVFEILPEHARETTIKLNHWFFKNLPHLFHVFQVKSPQYLVQRADIPMSEEVLMDEKGRRYSELTAEEVAEKVVEIAVKYKLQHSRPTRLATIGFRMPFELRTRVKVLTWKAVIDVRPDDIEFVTVGGDSRWIRFKGPKMEELLDPPAAEGESAAPRQKSAEAPTPQEKVAPPQPALKPVPLSPGRGWGAAATPIQSDL